MTDQEINLFIIFGGMLLFATVIGIYDLLAERQHHRERKTATPIRVITP